jgi:hypothetical protein
MLVTALVSPRINDQKQKDEKADGKQGNCSGIVLPKRFQV